MGSLQANVSRYFFKNTINQKMRPFISYKGVDLSGETDVNLKQGFAWSRALIGILDDLKKDSGLNKHYDALMRDKARDHLTHSFANISLMPKTGNMQQVKQGIGNDRIDTFIWALNEFYAEKSCLLFNFSSKPNLKCLNKYLGSFKSVYHYCKTIYHIDEHLVDDMIRSGAKAIDTPERANEFMDLAIRFWDQKIEYLEKELNRLKDSEKPSPITTNLKEVNKLIHPGCKDIAAKA